LVAATATDENLTTIIFRRQRVHWRTDRTTWVSSERRPSRLPQLWQVKVRSARSWLAAKRLRKRKRSRLKPSLINAKWKDLTQSRFTPLGALSEKQPRGCLLVVFSRFYAASSKGTCVSRGGRAGLSARGSRIGTAGLSRNTWQTGRASPNRMSPIKWHSTEWCGAWL